MNCENVHRSTFNFQCSEMRPVAALSSLNVERWKLDVERFPTSRFALYASSRGKTSP